MTENLSTLGFILVFASCLASFAVAGEQLPEEQLPEPVDVASQDWKTRLPISLDGEYPEGIPKKYVDSHWHGTFRADSDGSPISKWEPEHFFTDKATVELCRAVKEKDVATMEMLISAGADVNAKGGGNFNPLYWAFHVDDDPRPFECLIRHGANPNVLVDIHLREGIEQEKVFAKTLIYPVSVSHAVCGRYCRLFKLVFENGGDPNLYSEMFPRQGTPFQHNFASAANFQERVKLLTSKGASLDKRFPDSHTKLSGTTSTASFQQALILLHAGANHRLYYPTFGRPLSSANALAKETEFEAGYEHCQFRLIHILVAKPPIREVATKEQEDAYKAMIKWLEDRGESLAEAETDLKRWAKWAKNKQYNLIKQEHELRLAKEAKAGIKNGVVSKKK